MPNQNNFRSDITTETSPRFLASRIVSFPEEGILFEQIPASFGYEVFDNIEVHFYTIPENILLLSLVIDGGDSDILKSHVVSYPDDTFKNYVRIDFTALFNKTQTILLPGEYKMVLNFFADEIGSYNNRKLYIQEISESRTEVQLGFFDTNDLQELVENETELREFIEPSFPKPIAVGVADKIFRSGVQLQDDLEGITYNNILDNIGAAPGQTIEDTIGRIRKLSSVAESSVETSINEFLVYLYGRLREEIVINGDRRIQEDEFEEFIEKVLAEEIGYLQSTIDNRIVVT
jgi:hypothetical protein